MKVKVGVFFGGKSVEHEVSIISALQAVRYIDKEKYDVIPIYITKNNEMYVGEDIGNIEKYKNIKELIKNSQRIVLLNNMDKLELYKYPFKKLANNYYDYIDVAFPIVHGTNVEDGSLQGYLKTLNIPFVGCDVTSSAVGMDKYIMKTILKDNNIPVLNCLRFNAYEYNVNAEEVVASVENSINYPIIVKPINLGSSVGIKIAHNKEELYEALEYSFSFAKNVLVEKAIVNLKEINCSVLGDYEEAKASECEEPIGSDEILSYEDKYISGGSKKTGSKGMTSLDRKLPADISNELKCKIQDLAIKTFKALNCNGVSRIDFMIDLDTNEVYVNEINTIPGSLSFYLWKATGTEYTELLDSLINLALKRDREEKDISYSFDTNILEGVNLGGLKGSKKI